MRLGSFKDFYFAGLAGSLVFRGGYSMKLRTGIELSAARTGLDYYTRENCKAQGLLPEWKLESYVPETNVEKIFKTPLNFDLLAAAHSGNETGFEQTTADWGCDFEECYGTGPTGNGCVSIGFFGPGAKDPAGGGCPRGPVKAYEDLVCAVRLGLESNPTAFQNFCDVSTDPDMGMFECLSFIANALVETGAFSETEERDPRPYCWNRQAGNTECCPSADHQPCLQDSDRALSSNEFPQPNNLWLTDDEVQGKCCTYHGRGFLQVSYEPNYRALSKAMVGDETVLWHHPYKLRSDGVAGWTSALWFWFNEHPAQVANEEGAAVDNVAPREQLYKWRDGQGFPGTINIINGGECSGAMGVAKALSRVSLLFAIAHRMNAVPPKASDSEEQLAYYPLPGTAECEANTWCRSQFHNSNSPCPVFSQKIDCGRITEPYIVNASTPMGFWRHTIKTVAIDGETALCQLGSSTGPTPAVWKEPQADFTPIRDWWIYLDVHRENVCPLMKLMFRNEDTNLWEEGQSELCNEVCWKQFAWDVTVRNDRCDEPQKPCQTTAEYISHPLPRRGWETGDMGDYMGGAYLGRVGPGMVMALNGEYGLGDTSDRLCYHFGATACHWNIGMGCYVQENNDVHNCRVFHPDANAQDVLDTLDPAEVSHDEPQLSSGQLPTELQDVLQYYDESECPTPDGKSVLEQVLPRGAVDLDFLFSAHYSQSDGFANSRYDTSPDDPTVNVNGILHGFNGPNHVWKRMLCAFNRGVPSDPDYFHKKFGLRRSVSSRSQVPYPLSEDELKFAKLEFIAFAANMLKETGAMGQAEEQDPRCYCNYQGGADNPCCPNDWGNNPPCFTSTDSENKLIPADEMERGTTTAATCCTYHGRGFLQTSYEYNYGGLGEFLFESSAHGISGDRGRQLLVNYPQVIDPFGVTGWAATFAFWLHEHPCQYCDGRNTTTVDWNAHRYSPHDAMVDYDVPGEGLGLTFTIINGQECEAELSSESNLAFFGAQDRLSLFYNLAYRLKVMAPGESVILPLPGTKECDASAFCRGTFLESEVPRANYRPHAGGCWALTPNTVGTGMEIWPYCRPTQVEVLSKFGAQLNTASFSMRIGESNSCELLHEFTCGAKIINASNKPSMFTDSELIGYTDDTVITTDYDDPEFVRLLGLTPDDLCGYAVLTDPENPWLTDVQTCEWWCLAPAGASRCRERDPTTCRINPSGASFVACANAFFEELTQTHGCKIILPTDSSPVTTRPPTSSTTVAPGVCQNCSRCISTSGDNDDACSTCQGRADTVWPCNQAGFCECASGGETAPDTPVACVVGCSECTSSSGLSWETDNCKKCANGQATNDWPCQTAGYCVCASSVSTSTSTSTSTTTTTASTSTSTTTITTSTSTSTTTITTSTSTSTTTITTSTTTTKAAAAGATVCSTCDKCVGIEAANDGDCLACSFGGNSDRWICSSGVIENHCRCGGNTDAVNNGCDDCACVSISGESWADVSCARCSNGANKIEWPCNNMQTLISSCRCA